jgi:hypothetical protein
VGSGLARSERQILRAVAEGTRHASGRLRRDLEDGGGPYCGDSWRFRRIDELAQGSARCSRAATIIST